MEILNNYNLIKFPKFGRVRIDIGLSYLAPNSALWLKEIEDVLVVGVEPLQFNQRSIFDGNGYGNPQLRISMVDNSIKSGPTTVKKINNAEFVLLPFALDDIDAPAEKTFYHTANDPGCSSLYKPNSFPSSKEIVKVIPSRHMLESLLEQYEIIEFIKIDAQGKDFEIIKNFDVLIRNVGYLYSEITTNNEYDFCEPAFDDINNYMKYKNFELVKKSSNDALWVNNSIDTEQINPVHV